MNWSDMLHIVFILLVYLTSLVFFIVSSLLVKKYLARRNLTLKYLTRSLYMIFLAQVSMSVGLTLDYLNLKITQGNLNIFIALFTWLIFMTLANVFIVMFITTIFIDENNQVIITLTALNALPLGLFLPYISFSNVLYTQHKYSVLYFVIISLLTYFLYFIKCLSAMRTTKNKQVEAGFKFMMLYALFMIMGFITFAFSLRFEFLNNAIYSPVFFFNQVFMILAAIFAYLGFIYPEWVKRITA